MTDNPAPGWPRTPSGVIDWEKAFEDPKTGLIPLIRQAHSPTALRECMIAIVSRLYTRKDDPSEVERFASQLKTMIPDQVSPRQLPRLAETMEAILRQIKTERTRLAAAAESAKASAPSAVPAAIVETPEAPKPIEDRRSKSEPTSLIILAKAVVAKRLKKIAAIAATIAGAVFIAGVMIDIYLDAAPQREAARKAAVLLDQIQAASQGAPIGTHIYGGAIYIDRMGERAAVEVEGLTPDQCTHAGWMLAKKGTVSVGGSAPVNTSLTAFRDLCAGTSGGTTLMWIPRSALGGRQQSSGAQR